MITRFSVPNLHEVTIHLTNVINGKSKPDLILTNAKILSTYTDSILDELIKCIQEEGEDEIKTIIPNTKIKLKMNNIDNLISKNSEKNSENIIDNDLEDDEIWDEIENTNKCVIA